MYASITTGHGLGFKKDYPKSWRSNRKVCKKGVFEIVSTHWVDLINYHYQIKKIQNLNLRNYIKNANGIDNLDKEDIAWKTKSVIPAIIFHVIINGSS